jgi:hypothetical protein
MKSEHSHDSLVPPGLIPEIEAAAQEEHRDPRELVSDAVTRYLSQRRLTHPEQARESGARERREHTPAEAVARILELRKGNRLPEGVTIKDLINYGRA